LWKILMELNDLLKILMELNDLRKILMAIKTSDQRLHVRFDVRWRVDIFELWYSIDTEWKLWCYWWCPHSRISQHNKCFGTHTSQDKIEDWSSNYALEKYWSKVRIMEWNKVNHNQNGKICAWSKGYIWK